MLLPFIHVRTPYISRGVGEVVYTVQPILVALVACGLVECTLRRYNDFCPAFSSFGTLAGTVVRSGFQYTLDSHRVVVQDIVGV